MSAFRNCIRAIRQGRLDDASPAEKDATVNALIYSSSAAAGLVALQPVPFLDLVLLIPIHVAMFEGIGRVRGYHLDKKSILETLKTWRRSLLVQQTTVIVPKLVPVFGWAVSAASAHALTYAMGRLADYYFRTGRSMLPAELRAMLGRLYRERLEELRKSHSSRPGRSKATDDARAAGRRLA